MKTSLVITTYNEEKNIKKLFNSIVAQSKFPDEIVIVDAGSKDKTINEIKKEKFRNKNLNVKFTIEEGNRATGRNKAINKATGEIIIVSDAGCVLDKNWFNNMIKPFKDKKVDVVAGYYHPVGKSILQKCVGVYTSVMSDKLDENNFLPSSRSIAFKKSAWEEVKGYPEQFNTCEDLVFANNLKKAGFKFVTAKNAIVYWEQKNSFKEIFFQFYNYAKGDGRARFFREKTPFLFLRYLFFFYLFFLNIIIQSRLLLTTSILILSAYIVWAISKNFKYVKNNKAFYYLPALQFLSDFAVILGTSIGFLSSLSISETKKNILKNKFILIICFIYVILMLNFIKWGLPNDTHPFSYHMDEWHFLQSIRAFFKYGTTTISGSANIPFYHVFSSMVFLVPFYLLKIINPFEIKSALENIFIQQKLFEILRLHTLFYGILSIIFIYKIIKKYIGVFPKLFTAFFLFTPIWISLSNYYKYDVVLIFWIVLTLYLIFKFYETKEINNFIFAGISTGFALSTKFTAAPLFAIYLLSFFLFFKKNKFKYLLLGIIISIFTFIFFGIPDLIFGKGDYQELLFSTLIKGPEYSAGFNINYDPRLFLIFKEFPSIFGYFLFYAFLLSFIYLSSFSLIKIFKKTHNEYIKEIFLIISFIIFIIPLLLFNIEGGGNRALVLLPFIILILSFFIKNILLKARKKINKAILLLLIIGLLLNIFQSYSWYSVKFYDPREVSSLWILKNIPKDSEIGIENIPIYQMLPNIVLKEYYLNQQYNVKVSFKYKIVNKLTAKLPEYVIVTNDFDNLSYISKSEKKDLVARLNREKFKKIKTFNANLEYFNLSSDKLLLNITNILPVPVIISIYKNINN